MVITARLNQLYADYLETVERLERERKPGEGIFGFKGGPKDNPCHERFVEDITALQESFRAENPGSADVTEVLRQIYKAPGKDPVPKTAYWMLIAVHGLTDELVPLLTREDAAALLQEYTAAYPKREWFPAQKQLVKKLKARSS